MRETRSSVLERAPTHTTGIGKVHFTERTGETTSRKTPVFVQDKRQETKPNKYAK